MWVTTTANGAQSITSLTWTTPPSGYWAILMVRPLYMTTEYIDPLIQSGPQPWCERDMFRDNAFALPVVHDDACINIASLAAGGGRLIGNYFGKITYVWN